MCFCHRFSLFVVLCVLLLPEYALGTCQSSNRYVVVQVDCEAAAASLGLSFAYTFDNRYYPSGCIKIDTRVYFNTDESSAVSCGSSGYYCLCRVLGNFPHKMLRCKPAVIKKLFTSYSILPPTIVPGA